MMLRMDRQCRRHGRRTRRHILTRHQLDGRQRDGRQRDGHRRAERRRAITLYEVMLSIAIMLPALALLTHAIHGGARTAVHANLQTESVIRCESLLAEASAGILPLATTPASSFEDNAEGWLWRMEVQSTDVTGLLAVEVHVTHANAAGSQDAACTLVKLLRDPELLAAQQAAVEGEAEAAEAEN